MTVQLNEMSFEVTTEALQRAGRTLDEWGTSKGTNFLRAMLYLLALRECGEQGLDAKATLPFEVSPI